MTTSDNRPNRDELEAVVDAAQKAYDVAKNKSSLASGKAMWVLEGHTRGEATRAEYDAAAHEYYEALDEERAALRALRAAERAYWEEEE